MEWWGQFRLEWWGQFQWNTQTEVGAARIAVIQSLLVTCRLQGIDPYTYLVDVLQRVGDHPAKDVVELTPRLWKEKFGADPMKSDLGRIRDPLN